MPISENLAKALQRYRKAKGLSIRAFADEIGIAKNAAVDYLSGSGNPRADTLDVISERTSIPITEIVSAPLPGQEQAETIMRAAKELSSLPPDRREKGLKLFRSLMELFAEEDHS